MTKKVAYLAGLVAIAAAFLFWQMRSEPVTDPEISAAPQSASTALVQVTVPELTGQAKTGEQIFNAACAACHGINAAGVDGVGPPLVHKIYEPSHHGDVAFMSAPRIGVRGHHWPFGNMPPVEGLTDGDIIQIIAYVRTLQRANGIN